VPTFSTQVLLTASRRFLLRKVSKLSSRALYQMSSEVQVVLLSLSSMLRLRLTCSVTKWFLEPAQAENVDGFINGVVLLR
jgi:hypothetical protein